MESRNAVCLLPADLGNRAVPRSVYCKKKKKKKIGIEFFGLFIGVEESSSSYKTFILSTKGISGTFFLSLYISIPSKTRPPHKKYSLLPRVSEG